MKKDDFDQKEFNEYKNKKRKATVSEKYLRSLPKKIIDIYAAEGIEIDNADENGDISYYFSYTTKRIIELELDFILANKGIDVTFASNNAVELFNNLKIKISDKYEDVSNRPFIWEALMDFSRHDQIERLAQEVLNDEVIMFFGAHVNNSIGEVYCDLVFNVNKFIVKESSNYQWLTSFDDFNSPFHYRTMYKGNSIPNEGFLANKDMTWVYCFNHEGYEIFETL